MGGATARSQTPGTLAIPARDAAIKTEGGPVPGGWNLWSNGRVGQRVEVPRTGDYMVVVRAWGSPAAGTWPELALLVDELEVQSLTVDRDRPADYRFRVRLEAGPHELAAAFTNDAKSGREDRNLYLESLAISSPPGTPASTLISGKPDPAVAERKELALVRDTEREIEQNRKSDLTIRALDPDGNPVAGVRVSASLTNHEFLFGCNIYGFGQSRSEAENHAYQERFAELFNYATVGFYWRWYEPRRGQPRYHSTDEVVAWCLDHGIKMKGHPLLWGDQAGIPDWSAGQPDAATRRARVEAIMGRYRGRIGFYEVVNEPSHLPLPEIDEPYRWARAADPDAYLIVNDYHVLADGTPSFYRLLAKAIASGVPFDGVGIQAHEPRTMRFPLDRVRAVLDRYSALDKELHITEFTPASSGARITGSHLKGVWDEAVQADYAEKFYRVCFAHPAVRAITWWDLSDQHSWLKGGGMLHADMSPKPVYEQLRRLIRQEWTTHVQGTTDASGRYTFRGFRGTYRIKAEVAGKNLERTVTLGKRAPGMIDLTLRR
jgi:GH35 family endo-1,4-beta-xylanase